MNETVEEIRETVKTAKFQIEFAVFLKAVGREEEADKAWNEGLTKLENIINEEN